MKKNVFTCLIASLICTSFMFSGCAWIGKQNAKSAGDLLLAAGFTMKMPQKPEEEIKLQALTPLKMVRLTKDGEVFYVYPDPYNCKCAYIGNEKQYGEYKRLAVQQQIADENLMAADEMDDATRRAWWW